MNPTFALPIFTENDNLKSNYHQPFKSFKKSDQEIEKEHARFLRDGYMPTSFGWVKK